MGKFRAVLQMQVEVEIQAHTQGEAQRRAEALAGDVTLQDLVGLHAPRLREVAVTSVKPSS